MNLYANLDLEREPFSNSPDPSFLHDTRQHATCLQELEISLRLRRGLNVITGDIGTGKTTLCRSLLRAFAEDSQTDMHLLLDPHFGTPEEFLRVILGSVSRLTPDPDMGLWELKEALKQQLFRLGMVERRLVVLIIDEGQKMSQENLELLREMLNYETNSSKLLQIVIFAQRELEPMLAAMPNLVDRINVRRRLRALTLTETRQMVRHRLKVAASAGGTPLVSFSGLALWAIHKAAKGSPRKIVRLCHMAMLEMLVRGKTRVGLSEARTAIRPEEAPRPRRRAVAVAAALALILGLGSVWLSLNPSGPVLGGLGHETFHASPAAGQGAEPRVQSAQPESPVRQDIHADANADSKPEAKAEAKSEVQSEGRLEARAERRSAMLAADGLTLMPSDEAAPTAPAGLTLLPPRDLGPSVRSPIDRTAPAQLRVAAPEQNAPETGSRASMFRTVAFNLADR